MSDHLLGATKMVHEIDVCAGCMNLRPDGNHEWACLECKRWWPDKYEARQESPHA